MNDQSGWQGLQGTNPTSAAILDSQSPSGQYAVDPSPDTKGGPAGTPDTGALGSIAMLAMLA